MNMYFRNKAKWLTCRALWCQEGSISFEIPIDMLDLLHYIIGTSLKIFIYFIRNFYGNEMIKQLLYLALNNRLCILAMFFPYNVFQHFLNDCSPNLILVCCAKSSIQDFSQACTVICPYLLLYNLFYFPFPCLYNNHSQLIPRVNTRVWKS